MTAGLTNSARTVVGWSEPDAPESADRLLTATELSRLGELRYAADRARFRSAHVLARRVVASLTGARVDSVLIRQQCRWCGSAHGRPYVDSPAGIAAADVAPYVSWSRAGERVVAAATFGGPIGVDVESVAAVAHADADRIALSPVEFARLRAAGTSLSTAEHPDALSDQRVRAVLWVRKESLLKATGDGLTVEPSELVVSRADEPARLMSWPARDEPLSAGMADLDLGADYAACVSVLGAGPPDVELRRVDLGAV